MRRRTRLLVSHDSDQSISDEEDFDQISKNSICSRQPEVKEVIPIQFQLEKLRDACQSRCNNNDPSVFTDQVEIPLSPKNSNFTGSPSRAIVFDSDDEILSSYEEENNISSICSITSGTRNPYRAGHQSSVCQKLVGDCMQPSLTCIKEDVPSSSLANSSKRCTSSKGGKVELKHKFSFCFQSNRGSALGLSGHKEVEYSIYKGKKMDQSEIHIPQTEVALDNNFVMQSMAELFDHHQGKIVQPRELSQHSHKHKMEDNDSPEALDSGQSSDEVDNGHKQRMEDNDSSEALDSGQSSDEDNGHALMNCVKECNHKTAIDKIYEALDAAPVQDIESRHMFPKRFCMFGKLQQMLQVEKERDLYFSSGLQAGDISDGCIDVEILSKSLEAKLSVCACSTNLYKNVEHIERSEESKPRKESDKKTLTIIFNSRVCNDVELEIGSSIRIHPPWREVQIPEKGEVVIMSTYFSRLSSD